MKISLSLAQPIIGEVVVAMFNMRTSAHIYHLSTPSFAAHTALNTFYDGIVGIADRFAETAIGAYGPIQNWPTDLTIGLSTSSTAAEYITSAAALIKSMSAHFNDQKDLDNILAEALELCNNTIYKLENLS